MRIQAVAGLSLMVACAAPQSAEPTPSVPEPAPPRQSVAEPTGSQPSVGEPSAAPVAPEPLVPAAGTSLRKQPMEPGGWRIIERESGPDNYYSIVKDPKEPYIAARYRPGQKTAVLGFKLDDDARAKARMVSWKWRAVALPKGAEECVKGKGDAAAAVYVTWKRGLRYYSLKYVWSTGGKRGTVCKNKRNPFAAQDTIIVEAGGPTGAWRTVEVDLAREFRNHFEGGDPKADVPAFFGVGIMSDGDQTKSESSADFADFVLHRAP